MRVGLLISKEMMWFKANDYFNLWITQHPYIFCSSEHLDFQDISLCFGTAKMLFNQSRGFKHCYSETDIAFLCGQNSCGCLDNIPGWGIRQQIYESREQGDYVRVREVYGSQSISLNQDSYDIKISQHSPGVTKSLSSCAWSIYNSISFIQHHRL